MNRPFFIFSAFLSLNSFSFVQAETANSTEAPLTELGEAVSLSEEELTSAPLGFLAFSQISTFSTNGFTIDNTIRNDVVSGYHLYYLASEGYTSNHGWNGDVANCDEGTVSSDFQEDVLRRINYYRAQVGLPSDIYFDPTKNEKSQKAALIFSRQNGLSHDPAIDFPSNPCLTADGDEAAGAGNISLGSYGAGTIDGLMDDSGGNNAAVGHRRWLLYPRAQEMGNGSIPFNSPYNAANCVWVIGNFKASAPSYAIGWPNAGYIPYDLIPSDNLSHPRWSFSYPGANFSSATVTMTSGGNTISLMQEAVSNGFGDNTIVWRPSGIPSTAPTSDTTYTVTISGVTGAPQSTYTYDVIAIDPYKLNEEATISGSATPFIGIDTTYTFTSVPEVESYELSTTTLTNGNWFEGAETSPTPMIIDNTVAALSLYTTALSATGSRSFQLTIPSFPDAGQNFEINRGIVPSATSSLVFKNRFRWVTTTSYLQTQISDDEGASWSTLWTRFGDANSSSGSSATWETSWQNVSVPIPSQYAGREVRIRFIHDHNENTSAFLGISTGHGCFVDDIEVTNSQESTGATIRTLAHDATSFVFNPSTADTYSLAIRPVLGGHAFAYGPSFVLNPVSLPAPVITSASATTGAQGEVFTYTVTADNVPASFNAIGLPAGLSIATDTGIISGNIAPGLYEGITISATNATGTGDGPLSINIQRGYEAYISLHYPGLGEPDLDDDLDGVANLIEVSLSGLDPESGDVSHLPNITTTATTLGMTINKSGVAGVDYVIEGTSDLVNGPWSTAGLTTVTDNATTLEVSYDQSSGMPYFLRVRVTENNDPTP